MLKSKTGLDYEIHVIEEIYRHGSILLLLSDCTKTSVNEINKLHTTASDIANTFFFYNANRLANFGYMTNSPGELIVNLSNQVSL